MVASLSVGKVWQVKTHNTCNRQQTSVMQVQVYMFQHSGLTLISCQTTTPFIISTAQRSHQWIAQVKPISKHPSNSSNQSKQLMARTAYSKKSKSRMAWARIGKNLKCMRGSDRFSHLRILHMTAMAPSKVTWCFHLSIRDSKIFPENSKQESSCSSTRRRYWIRMLGHSAISWRKLVSGRHQVGIPQGVNVTTFRIIMWAQTQHPTHRKMSLLRTFQSASIATISLCVKGSTHHSPQFPHSKVSRSRTMMILLSHNSRFWRRGRFVSTRYSLGRYRRRS